MLGETFCIGSESAGRRDNSLSVQVQDAAQLANDFDRDCGSLVLTLDVQNRLDSDLISLCSLQINAAVPGRWRQLHRPIETPQHVGEITFELDAAHPTVARGYAGDVWFPQPAPKGHPWRTMPHHGMTPHTSGSTLSAQARYAAGSREILECWFDGRPIRDEYLIVDGGKLAGTGAHSYSAGNATAGSAEAERFKRG